MRPPVLHLTFIPLTTQYVDDQDLVSMKEELDTPVLRDESVVAATPATPPAEPVPAPDSVDTPAADGDGEGASTSRFRQSKRTAAVKGMSDSALFYQSFLTWLVELSPT